MKTYNVLYAQDVPHYGNVELEALSDQHIVEAARLHWTASDFDPVDDPDWNNPVCKRIVQITDEAGNEIAADVRCDDYNLEYITDEEVIIHENAAELLDLLERTHACLDRIADKLLYDAGKPVSFLESREIEDIYNDAIGELAPAEALIRKARGET